MVEEEVAEEKEEGDKEMTGKSSFLCISFLSVALYIYV